MLPLGYGCRLDAYRASANKAHREMRNFLADLRGAKKKLAKPRSDLSAPCAFIEMLWIRPVAPIPVSW
jgi:hypothetical protein